MSPINAVVSNPCILTKSVTTKVSLEFPVMQIDAVSRTAMTISGLLVSNCIGKVDRPAFSLEKEDSWTGPARYFGFHHG
jgi:hypothetical protein